MGAATPMSARAADASDAIIAIKELFWRRGYGAASIEDVVQATGFNRYALYTAFGGKRELFLAALDSYYQERKSVFLSALDDPAVAPLDAIRRVFEFAITEMAERSAGCLMCNVATEFGKRDPLISDRIESYLDEIRNAYIVALSRAQAAGDLNASLRPEDAADMLIAVKLGLGVHAKNQASAEKMLAILDAAIRAVSRERVQ